MIEVVEIAAGDEARTWPVMAQLRRSQGVGKALLDWLRPEARRQGCDQIHLDSRLIRLDAHRFYEREGFEKIAYHFTGQA